MDNDRVTNLVVEETLDFLRNHPGGSVHEFITRRINAHLHCEDECEFAPLCRTRPVSPTAPQPNWPQTEEENEYEVELIIRRVLDIVDKIRRHGQ